MGYYLVLKHRKLRRGWRLQFRQRIDESKEQTRDVPESEFQRLGFQSTMTIEEARARKDQLNATQTLKRVEEKRAAIARRQGEEDLAMNAFLGPKDVQEFEEEILFARRSNPKKASAWNAARRCLLALKIQPREYFAKRSRFYSYFVKQKFAPSYVSKVLGVINLWGEFQAMKYGHYFKRIDLPSGDDRYDIAESYFQKNPLGKTSAPLTPEMLESKRAEIPERWYNWLYLSIWLGLRPIEVDRLKKPEGPRTWWITEADTIDGNQIRAIAIYQSKLVKLPPEKRHKLIPLITKEQELAVEIIRGREFSRPSHPRYLQKYFPGQVYLYGGRKGFSRVMRSLGQDQLDYSRWLGHQTTLRTEGDYEEKLVLNVKPITPRTPSKKRG